MPRPQQRGRAGAGPGAGRGRFVAAAMATGAQGPRLALAGLGLLLAAAGVGAARAVPMPGAPMAVPVTDPGVQAAARAAVGAFNRDSDDPALFRVRRVLAAQSQVRGPPGVGERGGSVQRRPRLTAPPTGGLRREVPRDGGAGAHAVPEGGGARPAGLCPRPPRPAAGER